MKMSPTLLHMLARKLSKKDFCRALELADAPSKTNYQADLERVQALEAPKATPRIAMTAREHLASKRVPTWTRGGQETTAVYPLLDALGASKSAGRKVVAHMKTAGLLHETRCHRSKI